METPYRNAIRRGATRGMILAMFSNGPLFLWWASSSYSWGIPLFGHELLVLIGLGAFGLSAISLSLLLFAKSRLTGVALLVGSLIYVELNRFAVAL